MVDIQHTSDIYNINNDNNILDLDFTGITTSIVRKTNNRGQYLEDVDKNVIKGKEYEDFFKDYILSKYNIDLIHHPNQYNSYDFHLAKNPNILIEFKRFYMRTEKNNKMYIYDEIVIPKKKIDDYIEIYKKGLLNNELKHFFYIISFYGTTNGVPCREHKYLYLDLHRIIYECKPRDGLTGKVDFKQHYNLPKKWFKPLANFNNMISSFSNNTI